MGLSEGSLLPPHPVSSQSGTSRPWTTSSSPSTWWKLCSKSLLWASRIFWTPGTTWVGRDGAWMSVCVAGAPELPRGDKSRGCWCWKGCGPGHGAWAAVCDTQAPLCLQISSSWSWVRWTSCSFRSTRPPHVQSTTKASSASSGSLRPCEPCGRSESFGGSG